MSTVVENLLSRPYQSFWGGVFYGLILSCGRSFGFPYRKGSPKISSTYQGRSRLNGCPINNNNNDKMISDTTLIVTTINSPKTPCPNLSVVLKIISSPSQNN